MSVLDAVEKVLSQIGKPLHYREITQRMLDLKLWQTRGKTPHETVNARLAVDILKKGQGSMFQRTDKGFFALRQWNLPEHTLPARDDRTKGSSPNAGTQHPKTLSFTNAAEEVLEKFGGKRPMHYRTITEKAMELGLVVTAGKTPEATMYAQVLSEIQRKSKRGDTPRFVAHGKGFVGLSRWMLKGLEFQIEQHNNGVRKKLHARLMAMDPGEFEETIGELLGKLGFADVSVTGRSGDGGIDVRGTLVVGDVIRTRMAVQVKRWRNNVQAPTVQQVRGSLGAHEQGLIVATSDFSSGASTEAERADATPVALMNGEQLVTLLVENDIRVRRNSYDLIELAETDRNEPPG